MTLNLDNLRLTAAAFGSLPFEQIEELFRLAALAQRLENPAPVKDNAGVPRPATLNHAIEIGKQLRTQNNRGTSYPMFIVRTKRLVTCDESSADEHLWCGGGSDASPEEATELDKLDAAGEDTIIDGIEFEKIYLRATFEDKAHFLTQTAADEYTRANAHNLNAPHVFVASGHRNAEWQFVRAFFMKLAGRDYGDETW